MTYLLVTMRSIIPCRFYDSSHEMNSADQDDLRCVRVC